MTGIRIFSVHYLWEDCVSMVLGALIALTSWMVGDTITVEFAVEIALGRHGFTSVATAP